jgi:hypothetical protein
MSAPGGDSILMTSYNILYSLFISWISMKILEYKYCKFKRKELQAVFIQEQAG